MADNHDILGKADALLRRHVPPRPENGDDVDVPVLTELITPGMASAPHAPPLESQAVAPVHVPQPQHDDDESTRDLVAEVVNAVHERLARDLEHRITQRLVGDVHSSVARTLDDLRPEIASTVADAVAAALSRRSNR